MTMMTEAASASFSEQMPAKASQSLPAAVRSSYNTAHDAISQLHSSATSATGKLAELRADDVMNPAGRDRLIRERIEGVRQAEATLPLVAEAALEKAPSELMSAALPKLDAQRGQNARQDVAMILESVRPSQRMAILQELAGRDDDVAALVASQWGHDYLRFTAGMDTKADELHRAMHETAAHRAASSNDNQRRTAARLFLSLPNMRTALGIARGAAKSVG